MENGKWLPILRFLRIKENKNITLKMLIYFIINKTDVLSVLILNSVVEYLNKGKALETVWRKT